MIVCSFCGYSNREARYVFAGPTKNIDGLIAILAICSCCVRYCEVQGSLMDRDARKREAEQRRGKSVCDGWLWHGERREVSNG